MFKTQFVSMLAVLFLSCALQAENTGQSSPYEQESLSSQMTDDQIEEKKKIMDRNLQKRVDLMEKQHAEMLAAQNKRKDERVAFERQAVKDKKTLLDSLKGKSPQERSQIINQFRQQEQQKRQAFHESQKIKIQESRQTNKTERMEMRKEFKQEKQQAKEHWKEERATREKQNSGN